MHSQCVEKIVNLRCLGWIGGILIFCLAMMTPFDFELTLYLNQHRISGLCDFMKRSMFEGEWLGGSDIPVIVFIFAFISYLVVDLKGIEVSPTVRAKMGFMVYSGMIIAFIGVHGPKLLIGRARPSLVFDGKKEFTNWFEFGPHLPSLEHYSGSLPSGHVATVGFLLTISFLILGIKASIKTRILAILWTIITIIFAALMGASRAMTSDHWVSDSLISMIIVIFLVLLTYLKILRMPYQIQTQNSSCLLPKLWELKLATLICLTGLFYFGFLLALREIVHSANSWNILTALVSVVLGMAFLKWYMSYNGQVFSWLKEEL